MPTMAYNIYGITTQWILIYLNTWAIMIVNTLWCRLGLFGISHHCRPLSILTFMSPSNPTCTNTPRSIITQWYQKVSYDFGRVDEVKLTRSFVQALRISRLFAWTVEPTHTAASTTTATTSSFTAASSDSDIPRSRRTHVHQSENNQWSIKYICKFPNSSMFGREPAKVLAPSHSISSHKAEGKVMIIYYSTAQNIDNRLFLVLTVSSCNSHSVFFCYGPDPNTQCTYSPGTLLGAKVSISLLDIGSAYPSRERITDGCRVQFEWTFHLRNIWCYKIITIFFNTFQVTNYLRYKWYSSKCAIQT